ncbi:MAG: PLP-dependent aminotransferase family protein [Solirubrobacteraceae bacterium]
MLNTAGGMQGIDLVCKLFVDPGDLVAVEAPTYTNGSETIASYEGTVLEVPVDEDGMQVEVLAARVAEAGVAPKLVYTIPTFQNPSGTTMSLERRMRLLELVEGWGSVLLEDDPYRMLRFAGDPVPSLVELSGHAPWVIGVHTFSKIVAAGLRIGWVVAHPSILERMIAAKQCMDTCTNRLAQRLTEVFLTEGHMRDHLIRLRTIYRERKEAMQQALGEAFAGTGTRWTDPDGGFFLWVTFPEHVDTTARFPEALQQGVAYIPGSAFGVANRFESSVRLCFASTTPERTREGIERLRRTIALSDGITVPTR